MLIFWLFLLSPIPGAILGIYLKIAYPRMRKVLIAFYVLIFGAMIFGTILSAWYPGPMSQYPLNSLAGNLRAYVITPLLSLWLTLPFYTALTFAYIEGKPLLLGRADWPKLVRAFLMALMVAFPACVIALMVLFLLVCNYFGPSSCVL